MTVQQHQERVTTVCNSVDAPRKYKVGWKMSAPKDMTHLYNVQKQAKLLHSVPGQDSDCPRVESWLAESIRGVSRSRAGYMGMWKHIKWYTLFSVSIITSIKSSKKLRLDLTALKTGSSAQPHPWDCQPSFSHISSPSSQALTRLSSSPARGKFSAEEFSS